MTVVIGTAGHIDHGKTTLLAALTGTDADRLPEEQRRGLTIDVGYAHFSPDDGPEVDFVDVPGHDKLVGNMLVGAGEIDAALVVVAANDGPRAQTWEHLGLIDALGIKAGVVAITKADLVDQAKVVEVAAAIREALSRTSLAGAPIVVVSAQTGQGIDELRTALAALRDQVVAASAGTPDREVWLAIDRAFSSRGRGLVVTGSSRGRPIRTDEVLRVLPDGVSLRVRGLQVHDAVVGQGPLGGRVAVNLTGDRSADLRRGQLLATDDADGDPLAPVASDRMLVVLRRPVSMPGRSEAARWPPADGAAARLHIGTDQADAVVGRSGREDVGLADDECVAMLRLDRAVAVAIGHRFVLRRPSPAGLLAGGRVLDATPARGRSRRRQDSQRLLALAAAIDSAEQGAVLAALLVLRGQLRSGGTIRLAADVGTRAAAATMAAVRAHHRAHPDEAVMSLSAVRAAAAAAIRAGVSMSQDDATVAARALVEELLSEGRLLRAADGARSPEFMVPARDPELDASMSRLEVALDVVAPPPLEQAAAQAGCSAEGIRELERAGRIVIVDDDLAWSAVAYERLRVVALTLARSAPLTPAALRDATGTSRKFVMALLEDFARRGILTRTPAGHIPGPRA